MESAMFRKRSGTTDKGKAYEEIFTSHLILKLMADRTIEDFALAANEEGFERFDDVVLAVSKCGNIERYAIQLKHTRRLPKHSLFKDTGEFSIMKYMDSFEKLRSVGHHYKLIIFTNSGCKEGGTFTLNDEDFKIRMVEAQRDFLSDTSNEEGFCWKFQIEETRSVDSDKIEKYRQFFETFYLYTGQKDMEKLKEATAKEFQRLFSCNGTGSDKFFQFVRQWNMREGSKDRLTKRMMTDVIAVRLLTAYIVPFSMTCANPKATLLKEAILKFDVTIFDQSSVDYVSRIFGDFRSHLGTIKEVNTVRLKYQLFADYIKDIDDLTDEECTMLSWIMDVYPLIVRESETVLSVARLCEKKFLILGSKECQKKLENRSIFCSLSDLDSELSKRICHTFQCRLQGKNEVNLATLIVENEEVRSIVSTDHLVRMMENDFRIEYSTETLPVPYIKRHLSNTIIDYSFFDNVDKQSLIVISGAGKFDKIMEHLYHFNFVKEEDLERVVTVNSEYVICVTNHKRSYDKICEKYKNRVCHHFRVTEEEYLEWVDSKGNIENLDQFQIGVNFVHERNFFEFEESSSVNIICGHSGIGKSVFMRKVKNDIFPKFWAIVVTAGYVQSYITFSDDATNFLDYLVLKQRNNMNHNFSSRFLNLMYKKKKLVLLWDCLDELSDEGVLQALKIIRYISTQGYKQSIVTRVRLQKTLQREFNVLVRYLKEFDELQQVRCILAKLSALPESQILKIINKIMIMVPHGLLKNPLHIDLLCKLILTNPDAVTGLLQSTFRITDMFSYFVDEKWMRHCTERAAHNSANNVQKQIFESYYRNMLLKTLQKFALMLIFDEQSLKKLNMKEELNKLDVNKLDDECSTFLYVDKNNHLNFIHRCYAHFFAALYFSENYGKIKKFKQVISDDRYIQVKLFFDMIVARNYSARSTLLNEYFRSVESFDQITLKDACGQNPLQLVYFREVGDQKMVRSVFYVTFQNPELLPFNHLKNFVQIIFIRSLEPCLNDVVNDSYEKDVCESNSLFDYDGISISMFVKGRTLNIKLEVGRNKK